MNRKFELSVVNVLRIDIYQGRKSKILRIYRSQDCTRFSPRDQAIRKRRFEQIVRLEKADLPHSVTEMATPVYSHPSPSTSWRRLMESNSVVESHRKCVEPFEAQRRSLQPHFDLSVLKSQEGLGNEV